LPHILPGADDDTGRLIFLVKRSSAAELGSTLVLTMEASGLAQLIVALPNFTFRRPARGALEDGMKSPVEEERVLEPFLPMETR
jgi:hypothetical protein